MIKGINHVGIVVKNIDEVLSLLREAFGAEEIQRMEIPPMKQISSIVKIGEDCFELMEPTGPDGPAGSFLEAKGGGLHHVSLLCDDPGLPWFGNAAGSTGKDLIFVHRILATRQGSPKRLRNRDSEDAIGRHGT